MGFTVAIKDKDLQHPFYQELFSLKNQTILDVGAGLGEICLQLLGKGNTLICNEPETTQLLSIFDRAIHDLRDTSGLLLNNELFPSGFGDFAHNSLDAIIVHRVFTVMTSNTVLNFLREAHQPLKPGHGTIQVETKRKTKHV
ncbi:methyltransferase domain-containing protein [Parendozoicomonas sp. Alg238-R29]|uniref:methyltransferase domain-containing protein n=1 Tax=Parendozoicomonas sp. Alg238-R29 TaxID=2993446 RepID=UPI00248F3B0E|nr:methyltransferase domain-containing protein [Parendozoicomonas sp. Alg238-R29]